MEARMTTRTQISGTGSFVAPSPEAFPNTPDSFRNVVKLEHRTLYSIKDGAMPVFFTDRILLDIAGLDPTEIDWNKASIDCDLIKEIILRFPSELQIIAVSLQKGGSENVDVVDDLINRIGFTEEEFAKKGGGFFFVVVAVALLAGGCTAANQNKAYKQNTTPSGHQPAPGNDAGPDGGTPQ
jgi:hypothetical protein